MVRHHQCGVMVDIALNHFRYRPVASHKSQLNPKDKNCKLKHAFIPKSAKQRCHNPN